MKLAYPKSVAFIVTNEFCERFCFYGLRAILVLYLTRKLGYDDDNATITFHGFTSLAYFFPILGAIVADSWLGRYRTILYLSVVYMVGSTIVALGAIPSLMLPANAVTLIGLLLIAVGTGGIKPCVAAFGGDQFRLPEQAKQLAVFFSLFYMAINAGSLLSTLVTPILREDVHCFGEESCFSLAFGVPGALMIASIFIFIGGHQFYSMSKPSGNMIVKVSKCCYHAIRTRATQRRLQSAPLAHWLDYAQPRYGHQLVDDVKVLLRILLLYVPLPIFWALFDQQGSRWTFQASRMDGSLFAGLTIKPDQMQVVNPVLIIAFIPLWDVCVYPLLARVGVRRPLQKLAIGMVLVAVSFVMSALLEQQLERLDPRLPGAEQAQLRVINGMPSAFAVRSDDARVPDFTVAPLAMSATVEVPLPGGIAAAIPYTAAALPPPTGANHTAAIAGLMHLQAGQAVTHFVTWRTNRTQLIEYVDVPGKPVDDLPLLRLLVTAMRTPAAAPPVVVLRAHASSAERTFAGDSMVLTSVEAGRYDVLVDGQLVDDGGLRLGTGGVYAYVLSEWGDGNYTAALLTLVEPNSISMMWQLPQYVVVTAAEIMFSVTGLEFSFTEAPDTMKSVMQACWLLTVTVGNMLVMVIAHFHFFQQQSSEFLLFAGLMMVDFVLFVWLAHGYRYNNAPAPATNGKEKRVESVPATVVGITNSAYVSEGNH